MRSLPKLTATEIPAWAAASSTPRSTSIEYALRSWLYISSTRAVAAVGLTAPGARRPLYSCWRSRLSTRSRVAAPTSDRPFSTRDTVATDTPAEAAMVARVARSGVRTAASLMPGPA